MSLDDVIYKLRLLIHQNNMTQNNLVLNDHLKLEENISTDSETNFERTLDLNHKIQLENWTSQNYVYFENRSMQLKIMVVFFYCLIVLVSSFGNFIVCKIVFWNSAMRSTTNIFIGNLSVSDLLMTVLNIPLQLTQILSRNWPLNQFLCRCLPFFQSLSVNVSSFTMACIALDRYQVIAHPLKPRAGMTYIILKIMFIWIMATVTSLPYPAIADVEDDLTYDRVTRCRLIYPEPKYQVRQSLTIITVTIQFFAPLCITGITYFKICCIIWHRRVIGVISEVQRNQRYMAKWKTIKMLIIVFMVFVICWLPLNIYHIYQDFRGPVGHNKHNPIIFLACHWFAMSSVCYNPFLYCWLNDGFRTMAKSYVKCFLRLKPNHSTNFSITLLKRRKFNFIKNKHPSKVSTLSESQNSLQSSNKHGRVQRNSTKIDLIHIQPSDHEQNSSDKRKLNMSLILSDMKRKKSKIDRNYELETVDALMETKETDI